MITGYDTKKETVYRANNGKIEKCEKQHIDTSIERDGRTYQISFDYAKYGWKIYGYHYTGAVNGVYGYKNSDNQVLVWLETGKLHQLYFLNLTTKEIKPATDETQLKEILLKRVGKSGKNKPGIYYATEVQVSPEGKYILFRSNRNFFLTNWKGDYEKQNEEWYVKNIVTGEETKIEGVPGVLLSNEIGFADDKHIILCGDSEEISQKDGSVMEVNHPGIYDCEKKQLTWRKELENVSDFVSTMIYLESIEKGIQVYDRLLEKKALIPADSNWKQYYAYWDRDVICVFKSDTDPTCKVYIVKEDQVLNFENQNFADVDKIIDVKSLGDDTYLFVGEREKKKVGYLLKIKKVIGKKRNKRY